MSKKVLILSGSPRKGGNSDTLCDIFLKGAIDGGNKGEKIFLRSKNINYCNACNFCKNHDGKCVIKDDMEEIITKIQEADVIVLASPVYFYSIDAQMKTVIDRCFARWTEMKNKEFYYIMTSADADIEAMKCTLECFRGFASCLSDSTEKGVLYGIGVYEAGSIKDLPIMEKAYNMGKSIGK